jgi:hypothetical protein
MRRRVLPSMVYMFGGTGLPSGGFATCMQETLTYFFIEMRRRLLPSMVYMFGIGLRSGILPPACKKRRHNFFLDMRRRVLPRMGSTFGIGLQSGVLPPAFKKRRPIISLTCGAESCPAWCPRFSPPGCSVRSLPGSLQQLALLDLSHHLVTLVCLALARFILPPHTLWSVDILDFH